MPKPLKEKAAYWDIARMIGDAGGIDALIAKHESLGFRPLTPINVTNWRIRKSIPNHKLAEVLITLRHLFADKLDAFDYLKLGGRYVPK